VPDLHKLVFNGLKLIMPATESWVVSGPQAEAQQLWTPADSPDLPAGHPWKIRKQTFRSGLSSGVEIVEIDNGLISVFLIPTRGMGIWKIQHGELRIGWDAPIATPVHPQFVNLQSRNGLGWLDGFNELLCRCGLSFNGPPGIDEGAVSPIESQITLHGQIANRPAELVTATVSEQGMHLVGQTREATLFGPNLTLISEYLLPWGSTELQLTDRIVNHSTRAAEVQLLYHINIGTPLLEAGSRWQIPAQHIYCRDAQAATGLADYETCLGPTPGYAEQVYLCQPLSDDQEQTVALLTNAAQSQGVAVQFDTQTLPCFAAWKNTQPLQDGYCLGLEPATNFPNFKAIERANDRVVSLPAGETWSTSLTLSLLTNRAQVERKERRIQQLQRGCTPELHPDQQGLTEFPA